MPFIYTLVVTSCNRFELLDQTLESFIAFCDLPPAHIIVVEDSQNAGIFDVVQKYFPDAEIILNKRNIGQMASIDRAYGRVTTPYIFHCEDDWEFFRTGFIGESHIVLTSDPLVSMVGLRARSEFNPLVRDQPDTEVQGIGYIVMDPTRHPEHFSYSFNPGLRRRADAVAIGPFAALGGESDVSYHFKHRGFRNASLENPAVRHIGSGHHVDDPTQPKRHGNVVHRLGKSIRKRIKRLKRWMRDTQ
jgi:GT2 family glycosyltransferase